MSRTLGSSQVGLTCLPEISPRMLMVLAAVAHRVAAGYTDVTGSAGWDLEGM